MNIIIFSKDRACQLELLLRSMRRFYRVPVSVLWTESSHDYLRGYRRLMNYASPLVSWHKEKDFKADLLRLVDPAVRLTMFLCDDDVFKEPFEYNGELGNPDVLCLSLRLQPGLTHCYPQNCDNVIPEIAADGTFRWGRRKWLWYRGIPGDYGYPMSLDGHVFRTADILPLLHRLDYTNPNTLELQLSLYPAWNRPLMACLPRSPVMNIPVNVVQSSWENRHGRISAAELNEKFLSGRIIDTKNIYGIQNMSCHQEVELKC
jgi:hypothetical protein